MAYEHKPGTGTLFANDKKGNDKAPDAKGEFNLDGKIYKIACWNKTLPSGVEIQSLKIELKQSLTQVP